MREWREVLTLGVLMFTVLEVNSIAYNMNKSKDSVIEPASSLRSVLVIHI